MVAGIDLLAALLILCRKLLSLADCLVNILLGHIGAGGDGDVLLLAGAEILCGDVYDAVGVDVEGNLDLRNAAACRSDSVKVEAAEGLIVLRHLALALENIDLNARLIVSGGGEYLLFVCRNCGVAVDDLGKHAAESLDSEGKRSYVEKENALNVAAENAALNCRADSNALIGVDALEALFSGELLDHILNCGDTAGAADHKNLGDIIAGETCVAHCLTDRAGSSLNEMCSELIELCSCEGDVHVLRAGGVSGDIRQVDVCARYAREIALCLLSRLAEALHCNTVGGQIDAVRLLELLNEVLHDCLIEVIAAEAVVAGGCENLDNAVTDLEDGYVERAAAEVVDHDLLILLLIKTVSKSSRGRLIDDTLDVKSGDSAGVLRSLTLSVGEVCGNGDNSLGDLLSEICLGVSLELLEHHCRNLLRSIALAVDVDLVVCAHLALD